MQWIAGDAQFFFKVPSMPCQFPERFWTRNIYFGGSKNYFLMLRKQKKIYE
jgi:hypothetical protein